MWGRRPVTPAATILTHPTPAYHESKSGCLGVGVSAASTIVDSHSSEFIPPEVPRALMSGEKERP